jgi:hypothetical protein
LIVPFRTGEGEKTSCDDNERSTGDALGNMTTRCELSQIELSPD